MKSYESSKWYIKFWRQRWYIYAIFLYLKCYLKIDYLIDYLLDNQIDKKDEENLDREWFYIKRHVEINKMYKFSSKTNYHEE